MLQKTMRALKALNRKRAWKIEFAYWTFANGRERVEWSIWDGGRRFRGPTLKAAFDLAEAGHDPACSDRIAIASDDLSDADEIGKAVSNE